MNDDNVRNLHCQRCDGKGSFAVDAPTVVQCPSCKGWWHEHKARADAAEVSLASETQKREALERERDSFKRMWGVLANGQSGEPGFISSARNQWRIGLERVQRAIRALMRIGFNPCVEIALMLLLRAAREAAWTDGGGQFCDKGPSYRSALFPANEEEIRLAQESRAAVVARFAPAEVFTEILPAGAFWPVEEAHQDYYLKNPGRYKFYRWNCGRDQRLQQLWAGQASH